MLELGNREITCKESSKTCIASIMSAMMRVGVVTASCVQFPSAPGVVNMSHVVRHLNFGPSIPGQVDPLDGELQLYAEGLQLQCVFDLGHV